MVQHHSSTLGPEHYQYRQRSSGGPQLPKWLVWTQATSALLKATGHACPHECFSGCSVKGVILPPARLLPSCCCACFLHSLSDRLGERQSSLCPLPRSAFVRATKLSYASGYAGAPPPFFSLASPTVDLARGQEEQGGRREGGKGFTVLMEEDNSACTRCGLCRGALVDHVYGPHAYACALDIARGQKCLCSP
jgi:hypothetical protein